MSSSISSYHFRQSSFELKLYFHVSSVRPFLKFKMTDSAKYCSQFMSISMSSRHVRKYSFKLTYFLFFKCTAIFKTRNDIWRMNYLVGNWKWQIVRSIFGYCNIFEFLTAKIFQLYREFLRSITEFWIDNSISILKYTIW